MLVLDSTMAIDAAPDTDATFDDSVTVVLADDHLPDRMGFLRALEGEGFSVVAEVSDAGDAVGAVLRHRPDVCLLELGLRGGGITAIETISTKHPETRIAALADAGAEDEVYRAVLAGADGYMPTDVAPDRMSATLNALLRGEMALPRALTGRLVEELREPAPLVAKRKSRRISRALLYLPRFIRHFQHRLRSRMSVSMAWGSTRARMREYAEF